MSILRGMEGVSFLNRVAESTQRGSLWTDIPPMPSLYEGSSLPNGNPMTQSVTNFSPPMAVGNYPIINPLSAVNDLRSIGLGLMQPVVSDEGVMVPDTSGV